jgi:hypothetical protein
VIAIAASGQFGKPLVDSSGPIPKQDWEDVKGSYKTLWGEQLVTRMTDLPTEGKVPDYRVPYSGHDYPDKTGGTLAAMAQYDRAFNNGYSRAYKHEREDLDFHTTVRTPGQEIVHRGMFGRVISVERRDVVPTWYGHCNGWTAASIRHADPQKTVTRNGVVFTPAIIKGLLAELYMYSHTQSLGGQDDIMNPATFHLALTNWVGRKSHPIGMETSVGEPVINFPIHGYKSTVTKIGPQRYDVRTLITYTLHVPREYDRAPQNNRTLFFHYVVDTDAQGNAVAGYTQRDSARIDMCWVPLRPIQGGKEGNRGGNPYLDVNELMAIHRESVGEELLKKWVNVDPTDEERALAEVKLPSASKTDDSEKPKSERPESAPSVNDATDTTPAAPATTATADAAPAAASESSNEAGSVAGETAEPASADAEAPAAPATGSTAGE